MKQNSSKLSLEKSAREQNKKINNFKVLQKRQAAQGISPESPNLIRSSSVRDREDTGKISVH